MSDQTPLEKEYIPQSQTMWNNYQNAVAQNTADYGNIMGGYGNFMSDISKQGPTKFGFERVNAERPAELGEAYGYLRETMPGYREFAQTGGYSPTDIQELRARGVAPIRSAYGNTMMELNRARALGGGGGAPNYIAAASKAQREMPGQMADALTGVNAQLAQDIRQGRLAGLSGMAGVGGTMGGLSSQEAGRMLQAAMANQNADLQAQQLSEQSLQAMRGLQLEGLRGQTSLYGTTPGMASMFGNQALDAYRNRINLEQLRNTTGLGLLDAQIRAYGNQKQDDPWWKDILNAAGSVIPYLGGNRPTSAGPSGSTPMGYNTPNGMGGTSFQGYQAQMPNPPQGNYNPQTSAQWGISPNDPNFGQYGGGGGGDPMDTNYWAGGAGGGWGPGWSPFGGMGGGYWSPYEGGGYGYTGYTDYMPSGGGGNYYGGVYNPSYYDQERTKWLTFSSI